MIPDLTLTAPQLALYAATIVALFLTPGPVVLAIAARALSGGFRSAAPLAVGATAGDIVWPLIALLGVGWIVSNFEGFLLVLRAVAVILFAVMGILLIRNAGRPVAAAGGLAQPGGAWQGFAAGCAVSLGNPKAILFYMGVLPGFFDLRALTATDVAVITAMTAGGLTLGNLGVAALVARLRTRLTRPSVLARVTRVSGGILIAVAVAIPFL